jgi:hypothetical protein
MVYSWAEHVFSLKHHFILKLTAVKFSVMRTLTRKYQDKAMPSGNAILRQRSLQQATCYRVACSTTQKLPKFKDDSFWEGGGYFQFLLYIQKINNEI